MHHLRRFSADLRCLVDSVEASLSKYLPVGVGFVLQATLPVQWDLEAPLCEV